MRSKLFVPGSRPELFPKAVRSEADAISFDLEDAVAPDRKLDARGSIASFLKEHSSNLRKVKVVRVNAVTTAWFVADVEALVGAGVDVINLPKVESAGDVHAAIETIARVEKAAGDVGRTQILANIETPKGLRLAAEIAAADPRVIGLQLGLADLFLPLEIDRNDGAARQFVRMVVRLAAGEAGIAAYDAAFPDIARPELCREEADAARRLGFAGKSCIHPSQIGIANQVFAPRDEDVERANRVLDAAREAAEKGSQAFVVDGQLIDAPMISHAQAIVAAATRRG